MYSVFLGWDIFFLSFFSTTFVIYLWSTFMTTALKCLSDSFNISVFLVFASMCCLFYFIDIFQWWMMFYYWNHYEVYVIILMKLWVIFYNNFLGIMLWHFGCYLNLQFFLWHWYGRGKGNTAYCEVGVEIYVPHLTNVDS